MQKWLRQSDVAGLIGVHTITVGDWERRKSYPSPQRIPVLAKFLDMDASTLYRMIVEEKRQR